ncbi:molting carboxypeptidase A [Danaus plexippus plexippus]|uniref:Molting carboxypeptidase A n=1 Tax=Danaus plexippus plexippus TaxID=278856 RepID=A0A212FCE2_DANPL|nr:carboxypeptidase B-like [Danaus plexippus plexippus]OWR51416.1 molting carboxypeptidase A [Danaus plexippus plexippus]
MEKQTHPHNTSGEEFSDNEGCVYENDSYESILDGVYSNEYIYDSEMTIQNKYQTKHEVNHVNVDDSRYGVYRRPMKVGSKRFSYNHLSKDKPGIQKKGQEDNYHAEDRKAKRMDWNDYQRLDVIHSFLDELEYDYPSICTVGTIGLSREDRNLKILKVSNSDAHNPAVWLDAGIHAREWIAPAVATYIANHIVRNFSSLPSSITNKDWYFHPVVNPDGYEYSHTVDRMWRKNKAYIGGKLVGVDLNRNFSYGWGGKGSSETPTSVFYRGPEPFSEPESCAVRDVLLYSGIPFKVYITLHSYGQIILFPFAYKDELCPDYVRLLEGATVMSKAIHESSGNTYKVGLSRDVMYGAAGTSNDFSYGVAKIPYCYLLELRSKKHKFRLPKEEIEETGNEILSCIKALMEFIDEKSATEKTE